MSRIARYFRVFAVAAAVVVGMNVFTPSAEAADRVVLKNGQVIEGEIVKELDGIIWIRTSLAGITSEKMYTPEEIAKIERSGAPAPAPGPAPKPDEKNADEPATPSRPGVAKGIVITMGDEQNGDMVGVYMVANVIERAIPVIEKELGTSGPNGDRVVVLRVHSGGGYGAEVQKISDVIQNEYKTRWRTVGWIDTAISAAAMSTLCLEEIYFTTQGNFGACTGFYTLDKAVEGFDLEQSLAQMEKISARGGWNPLIMRSMQIQQPLSATVTKDGEVRWYADATSGEILVNRPHEILTFNADSAMRVKFSRGTADTLDGLARLMKYPEVEWVGKKVAGVPWPVAKAEQMQMDFRKKVKYDEDNTNRYFRNYQTEVGLAAQAPKPERAALVGKARQTLEQIKSMVRNNPAFARNIWGGKKEYEDWLKGEEKRLRDLMK